MSNPTSPTRPGPTRPTATINPESLSDTTPAAAPFGSMSERSKAQMDLHTRDPKSGGLISSPDDDRTVLFEGQTLYVRVRGGHLDRVNQTYHVDLYTLSGEPYATASVNMTLGREAPLRPGQTLINDRGLNQGVLRALIDAHVLEETGRTVKYFQQVYHVCNVLPERPRPSTDT